MMPPVARAVWTWIKKYWELVGAGLVFLVGILVGVKTRPRLQVPAPVDPDRKKIEEKTAAAETRAIVVAEQKKEEARAEYVDKVKVTVTALEQKTAQIENNPSEVNDYLHNVGDSIRKGEP